MWAATSADLEGKGGLYIQDCSVAVPGEAAESAVMALRSILKRRSACG